MPPTPIKVPPPPIVHLKFKTSCHADLVALQERLKSLLNALEPCPSVLFSLDTRTVLAVVATMLVPDADVQDNSIKVATRNTVTLEKLYFGTTALIQYALNLVQ